MEIDAGRHADKVAAADPAAATLGTDDEASGQPSVADTDRRPLPPGAASGGIKAGPQPSGREWRIVLPVLAAVALLGVAWMAAG
ncbi:hypothetical protein STVA_04840 [Allostella vacuolata]|nr:hypothetical protein STVA_04840 [Stella vacuolata]